MIISKMLQLVLAQLGVILSISSLGVFSNSTPFQLNKSGIETPSGSNTSYCLKSS